MNTTIYLRNGDNVNISKLVCIKCFSGGNTVRDITDFDNFFFTGIENFLFMGETRVSISAKDIVYIEFN